VQNPSREPVERPGLDGAELASQPPRLAGDQVQPDQSWTVEPHLLPAQAVGHEEVGEQIRRYGLRDGALQAITQGGGENYLSAFGLLLHASAFQIGLLSALPQLVGTWAQLLSVKAFHRFQHRKTAILAGSIGQAAMWLPLLAMPLLFPEQGPWLLIACAVAYFVMSHFAVPAANSLIADLVDPDRRGAYFGRRLTIMALTSFSALCTAGLLLQVAKASGHPWLGFAGIFAVAAVARLVSAGYLARIDEAAAPARCEAHFRLLQFLRQERGSSFQRFLVFSGLMHVSVLIAGPYFVMYLLRDLHFTYLEYGMWLAAGVLGQFVSLKRWGACGDRFGNKRILMINGFAVPFLPMCYLLGDSLPYLLAVNFMGGVIWAGLSLSLQNYVFDAVRPQDRAKGVALWNTVNAVGWFAGAMLGSWLATVAPSSIRLLGVSVGLVSNLPVVFFLSGILRLLVSLSLLGTFREKRVVEPASPREVLFALVPLKSWIGNGPGKG
jgi:MFS family permease